MTAGSGARELAERLDDIRRRVADACARAGRSPDEVTLVGVSKAQPLERLRWAYDAGLRVFGENRVQEGTAKAEALPDDIRWHLIGPLQSNKVKAAAGVFHTVHAVDRRKIARRLSREAGELGRTLDAFLEINIADEESKHGFTPADCVGTGSLDDLATLSHLRWVGLMAIPPRPRGDTENERAEDSRRWFRRLRQLRDEMMAREAWKGCPGWLSMGMSADFEIAIEEGATHVRVGTSIFGDRG